MHEMHALCDAAVNFAGASAGVKVRQGDGLGRSSVARGCGGTGSTLRAPRPRARRTPWHWASQTTASWRRTVTLKC